MWTKREKISFFPLLTIFLCFFLSISISSNKIDKSADVLFLEEIITVESDDLPFKIDMNFDSLSIDLISVVYGEIFQYTYFNPLNTSVFSWNKTQTGITIEVNSVKKGDMLKIKAQAMGCGNGVCSITECIEQSQQCEDDCPLIKCLESPDTCEESANDCIDDRTCSYWYGENCGNTEYCICGYNETCDPGNGNADEKGCVADVSASLSDQSIISDLIENSDLSPTSFTNENISPTDDASISSPSPDDKQTPSQPVSLTTESRPTIKLPGHITLKPSTDDDEWKTLTPSDGITTSPEPVVIPETTSYPDDSPINNRDGVNTPASTSSVNTQTQSTTNENTNNNGKATDKPGSSIQSPVITTKTNGQSSSKDTNTIDDSDHNVQNYNDDGNGASTSKKKNKTKQGFDAFEYAKEHPFQATAVATATLAGLMGLAYILSGATIFGGAAAAAASGMGLSHFLASKIIEEAIEEIAVNHGVQYFSGHCAAGDFIVMARECRQNGDPTLADQYDSCFALVMALYARSKVDSTQLSIDLYNSSDYASGIGTLVQLYIMPRHILYVSQSPFNPLPLFELSQEERARTARWLKVTGLETKLKIGLDMLDVVGI